MKKRNKMHTKWIPGLLILFGMAVLSGNMASTSQDPEKPLLSSAQIGNPAAAYCRSVMGYEYVIETNLDGSQEGFCLMPDGASCPQWDFYAGTCGAEFSYCTVAGLTLETRTDGQDPYASSYSVCSDSGSRSVFSVSDLIEPVCPDSLPVLENPTDTHPLTIPDEAAMAVAGENRAPSSFDWRNYNGSNWVTSVKDQDQCGSCWAFAAAGTVEASENILRNDPSYDLNLSEESLVANCPNIGSCGGCTGGHSYCAISRMRDYGIVDEACMPYVASYGYPGTCSRCSNWENRLYYAKNVVYGWDFSGATLKEMVSRHGPVTVYMGMGWDDYQGHFDSNDIYRCNIDSGMNHAVVVVGYSDAGGYWIVKNSWGPGWHDNGYFKVGYGECVIDSYIYTFVDTRKPLSSHSLSGTLGGGGYYTSNVSITLNASDAYGSGVDYIEYRLDGGASSKIYSSSGTVTVSTDGTHTLTYRAVDEGGNIGTSSTITFRRDTTAPTGSLSINNGNITTYKTLVTLNSTAADNLSGARYIRFRDQGGSWGDWQGIMDTNWVLPAVTDQSYTVEAEVKDAAGNISTVIMDDIALDIYPDRPSSSNFKLLRSTFGMSSTNSVSAGFTLNGTLSQPSMIGTPQSNNYQLASGYWSWMFELPDFLENYLPLIIH
jgi:C1A family cysteine protease